MNILNSRRKMRPISAVAGLGLLFLAAGPAQAAMTSATFNGSGGTALNAVGSVTGVAAITESSGLSCGVGDCFFDFAVDFDGSVFGAGQWEIKQLGTTLASGPLETLFGSVAGDQYSVTFDLAPTPKASTLGSRPLVDLSYAFAFGEIPPSGIGVVQVSAGALTAVPLPAAAWLFGSALGMVGVMGGARRRAQRVQSTV